MGFAGVSPVSFEIKDGRAEHVHGILLDITEQKDSRSHGARHWKHRKHYLRGRPHWRPLSTTVLPSRSAGRRKKNGPLSSCQRTSHSLAIQSRTLPLGASCTLTLCIPMTCRMLRPSSKRPVRRGQGFCQRVQDTDRIRGCTAGRRKDLYPARGRRDHPLPEHHC
ncbi:hypothetical protein SAMN04488587_0082 [Methanococcoides vulcani]|uniref:Uncharacterized protein n=1 Tax=Methanococcoides vulcani TaxID=1353158 RepID=A0A1H9Y1J5_9EURY|nr:hypothetical protein SAMN04488587_0082 [Methanococcoides vulcani]